MLRALHLLLFGFWARIPGRSGEGRAPAPGPAVPLAPAIAPAPRPEHERSFLETVRVVPGPAVPGRPEGGAEGVREDTLRALAGLRQIPALQSLVQGVTQIMGQDGVCLEEVAQALQKDSALCVRVLGMANSAAIAPELRIVDLQTALQMLGVARVRRVAQAVFTLRDAQHMTEGLDWRHLWVHALATAAIAEELDRRLRARPSPEVYLAALLHDVGKIALSTVAPEAYRDVLVASWNGQGRLEDLERNALGVDHREAGVIFARGNRLSQAVTEAIAHHDEPAKAAAHRFEVALVAVANFLSKARGLGFSGSRLDEADGELEGLDAWRILGDEAGTVRVAELEAEMAGFLASLRDDFRTMREGAA